MPTLCGLRRRGYTPSAIFTFVQRAGIAKGNLVDMRLLEPASARSSTPTRPRRMAVLDPGEAGHRQLPRGQVRGV